MPFRDRIKRVFHRGSPSNERGLTKATGATLTTTKSKKSKNKKKNEEWEDWPEHIYKPHEMPRMKYRRPPEQAHKESLMAYNWNEAAAPSEEEPSRSRSLASLYSPMGSRLPSRRTSLTSKLGPSRHGSRAPSMVQETEAGDGEGSDVANVGLFRVRTSSSQNSRRRVSRAGNPMSAGGHGLPNEPLVEHSSAEQSKADTPEEFATLAGDEADGAALEISETITESSGTHVLEKNATVTQAREDERAAVMRRASVAEDAIDGAALSRALTSLYVGKNVAGAA